MSSAETYMKEFNENFQSWRKSKSVSSENLLNRSLSLLYTSQNMRIFLADSVQSAQFYINIYVVINEADPKSDIVWSSMSLIQKVINNFEARDALINQFKYVPIIARFLEKLSADDKILKVLTILQDLTYGIEISWEEPYLAGLIAFLVDLINSIEDNPIARTSLSILINICYKNIPSVYLLLRTIPISKFSKKIKPFGILANKMLIILDNTPNVSDLHNFIKKSFMEIEETICNWNVPYLTHIVKFLTDTNNNDDLHLAFKEYKDFQSDFERLINNINSQMDTHDSSHEEENKNKAICFSLIFELLNYVLQSGCSLIPIILEIVDLCMKWTDSEYTSSKALNVIRTSVKIADDTILVQILKGLEKILPNLISLSENNTVSNEQTIAVLNLLIVLLKYSKSQSLVFSSVTESSFDKMLKPLISTQPEELNFGKLSNNEISKYLLCTQLLIEFANIIPNIWLTKIETLFETKQIQYVIARSLLGQNEQLCYVVFQLSKSNFFPSIEVAKIISKLKPVQTIEKPFNYIVNENFSKTICNNTVWVNNKIEERLDDLITHIFEAKKNSEFNNVATSELIELFQYRINLSRTTETDLNKRLDNASEEITNLSHQNSLLSNEMSAYYSMNCKMHLTQERLLTDNADYIKQRDYLKETVGDLKIKMDAERSKYELHTKSLEMKKAEIAELKLEVNKYRERETNNLEQIKQLEMEQNEILGRVEHLKKNIKLLEDNIKENQRLLEEKEKEHIKSIKAIDEFKASNMKLENIIHHLEKQVDEKNEQIRACEHELSETEEMRKTVLSLMESKRPKRKN